MANKKKSEEFKPTWMIYATRNGMYCNTCKEFHHPFLPGVADYHTDGLRVYGQMELRVVLDLEPRAAATILNTLGFYVVKHGRRFRDGDTCDDIFPSPVKFQAMDDGDGTKMLRVILPDPDGKFPFDVGCQEFFCLQDKPLSMLLNVQEMTH